MPASLPVAGTQQGTKPQPSRKLVFWREETVNKETKTRFIKALSRFRMIILCHIVSLVCHLLYNFICI